MSLLVSALVVVAFLLATFVLWALCRAGSDADLLDGPGCSWPDPKHEKEGIARFELRRERPLAPFVRFDPMDAREVAQHLDAQRERKP